MILLKDIIQTKQPFNDFIICFYKAFRAYSRIPACIVRDQDKLLIFCTSLFPSIHIFARNHLLLFQGVLVSDFLTFRTKNKPAVICRSLHRQQQVFPDAFIYFTIRSIPSVIRIPTHLLCLWCLLNTLLGFLPRCKQPASSKE